jgi:hypothetical protein
VDASSCGRGLHQTDRQASAHHVLRRQLGLVASYAARLQKLPLRHSIPTIVNVIVNAGFAGQDQ